MGKIGLSRNSKSFIKFFKYEKNIINEGQVALFIIGGREFYNAYKQIFKNGYEEVNCNKSRISLCIPSQNLHSSLVLYHLSIELLLKSLLCFKKNFNEKDDKNHKLSDLFKKLAKDSPEFDELYKSSQLLLDELGKSFASIRYRECAISIRPNRKKSKNPLEELSEELDRVYHELNNFVKILTGI